MVVLALLLGALVGVGIGVGDLVILSRGGIVNRTYGTHKVYMFTFFYY